MTLYLEKEYELDLGIDYKELGELVMEAALDYESCPYEAEVNCILTDNDSIQQINKEQREIDRPTEVLSFPMIEYVEPACFDDLEEQGDNFNPDTGELMLGDIVISLDKVKEQAESYGHSCKREFAFLFAHSMLHLMGYDHMIETEEKIMFSHQDAILEKLGISR